MCLEIGIEEVRTYIAVGAFVVSLLALRNGWKSKKIAERSLQISESVKREAEIEYLKTIPSVDIIDVVEVCGKHRVVLLMSNMRATPFRINSVSVSKRINRPRSIKNLIYARVDPTFDWKYDPVEDIVWNPQGDLDTEEKYVREASEFLIVKEQERVLVTIPNFSTKDKYQFKLNTTHGVVTISDRIAHNGKVYFCQEFRQTFT